MTDKFSAQDLDNSQTPELEALEHHLAVYGPDPSRWPLASQHRFAALMVTHPDAQVLLAEAKALHAIVFERAAGASRSGNGDAMHASLMRTIEAEQRQANVSLNAIAPARPRSFPSLGVHGRPAASLARRANVQPIQKPVPQRVVGLPAGAALAASLVLGILAGTFGLADSVLAPVGQSETAQADTSTEGDDGSLDAELAFGSDVADLDEEGTL